jgi:hypothetical protein
MEGGGCESHVYKIPLITFISSPKQTISGSLVTGIWSKGPSVGQLAGVIYASLSTVSRANSIFQGRCGTVLALFGKVPLSHHVPLLLWSSRR